MNKPQSAPALVLIRYGLRAMGAADLTVVHGWLNEPHVTRGWPNPEGALRTLTRRLSAPGIACCILTIDRRDAGNLQVYDPHHALPPAADEPTSGHPYRHQPRGTGGIDPFMGGARVIGRCGSRLIRRVIEYLLKAEIPCVATDPDPTHQRSLAALRRAGLCCIRQRDTAWRHVRLMGCVNLKPTVSP